MMQLFVLLLLVRMGELQLPPPRGFVNDFAGVIASDAVARMEAVIREVRERTRGDIAVVTLRDIGNRQASDVALQIGRQWKVGGSGEAGDPARNLGVVVLLVPRKDGQPGSGAVFISTGRGAEGFLPDARVGRIRDAMLPDLAREDYGGGLEVGVGLLAQAFADEFRVQLRGPAARAPLSRPAADSRMVPGLVVLVTVLVILIVLIAVSRASRTGRRRRGGGWWMGGGWSGGGFGGWGGGGGGFSGGFGGFGGGGGFSGGGAGGKF